MYTQHLFFTGVDKINFVKCNWTISIMKDNCHGFTENPNMNNLTKVTGFLSKKDQEGRYGLKTLFSSLYALFGENFNYSRN